MSCQDEKYNNMIYAYELGLLTAEDRQKFEEHFFDCEACFEELKRFRAEASLLKNDPEIQASVAQFLKERGYPAKTRHKPSLFESGKLWTRLVPIAVAAVILAVLILKDWQFELKPSQEVHAIENRLVVLSFENLSDPADSLKYGEIIANLVITDLTESHFVDVVSSQRLHDILNLLGKEEIAIAEKDLSARIAEKARARWILSGSILQTRPAFIVTYQLIEATTGNTIAARKIEGSSAADVFSVADKLTPMIKSDLTLPREAYQEEDRYVSEITTTSETAYRFYLAGVADYNKFYYDDAIENFQRSLEYDSTFCMAYYYLAILKDAALISRAVEYSGNATEKEKHYITCVEASLAGDFDGAMAELKKIIDRYPDEKNAYYRLGNLEYGLKNFDTAVYLFEKAIEIDPLFKTAYNQLAYTYHRIGNYDKSLWAINKYIDLAPGEANPYDTRGEIYAFNGNLDDAIESYKRALEIKPDFYVSLNYMGIMYLFKHDYIKADSCFRILASQDDPAIRSAGRLYLTYIPLQQGKYQEAMEMLDDAIAQDAQEQITAEGNPAKYLLRARLYAEKYDFKQALREFENYLKILRQTDTRSEIGEEYMYIKLLVDKGDISEARKEADSLRVSLEKDHPKMMYHYWFSIGYVEFAEGNFRAAADYFARITKVVDQQNSFFYFAGHLMLGRSLTESRQLGEAVRELELTMTAYTSHRAYWGDWSVKLHYYLGMAYERSGWNSQAVEQFETFLTIWKNADAGIAEIEDCKKRLAHLIDVN